MLKESSKPKFYKKYVPTMQQPQTKHLNSNFTTTPSQQRYSTLQSNYSKQAYLNQTKSPTDSIVQNTFTTQKNYQHFQQSILRKVSNIEEETNKMLEKKEREIYFMKIQLQNNEARLIEAQEMLNIKRKQNQQLKNQLEKVLRKEQSFEKYHFLMEENDKLKQSLQVLIQQKNQNWYFHQHKKEQSAHNNELVDTLKAQVQELKIMVAEMQKIIHNCPSCFSLKRQINELKQSYHYLVAEHSKLKQKHQIKQKSLLQNITCKIQENQNILRQNNHLKSEKHPKHYYLKQKRQKINDSVAKRCRTLTDHF